MFSSTISERVGRLTNLETFYIHDNVFEGTLPATLNQLSHLSECRRKRSYECQGHVGLWSYSFWSDSSKQEWMHCESAHTFCFSQVENFWVDANWFSGTIFDIALSWPNIGTWRNMCCHVTLSFVYIIIANYDLRFQSIFPLQILSWWERCHLELACSRILVSLCVSTYNLELQSQHSPHLVWLGCIGNFWALRTIIGGTLSSELGRLSLLGELCRLSDSLVAFPLLTLIVPTQRPWLFRIRSWRGRFLQSSGIWRLYVRIWLLVAHSIYILRPNLALCRITHVKSELSISYHPHGIWQARKNWWVLPACTRLLTMKCVRLIHAQHFSPPRDTHPPLEQLEWHNSDGVGLAPWYQISLSKCQQTDRIGSVWIGNADNSRYVHCPCDHSLFLPEVYHRRFVLFVIILVMVNWSRSSTVAMMWHVRNLSAVPSAGVGFYTWGWSLQSYIDVITCTWLFTKSTKSLGLFCLPYSVRNT
jgi:hypothetical protein